MGWALVVASFVLVSFSEHSLVILIVGIILLDIAIQSLSIVIATWCRQLVGDHINGRGRVAIDFGVWLLGRRGPLVIRV